MNVAKNTLKSILVMGYYNKGNLGDDSYQGIMGQFFPNEKLEFIASDQLSTVRADNYDAIIVGGGDVINDYFHSHIVPFLSNFKGPRIAFSIGIPFPSLITEKYLGYFDHVFTRNYEDVREIQKVLGSYRAHFIPDIALAYPSPSEIASNVNNTCGMKDSAVDPPQLDLVAGITASQHYLQQDSAVHRTQLDFVAGIFLVGNVMRYPNIVGDIAHIVSKLALSYNIILYCFHPQEDMTISEIVRALAYKRLNNSFTEDARLKSLLDTAKDESRIMVDATTYTASEMIQNISELDFALCMRYHSHIFCAVAGVPFVSISSTRKTRSFMKQAGLDAYQYQIELDDNGTPIGSNYDVMKVVCGMAIRDKVYIQEQLDEFMRQSRFLLSNHQAAQILTVSRTDLREGVTNFIRETGDYQNGARLLSNYIIGYPDSPYVWGMYDKLKCAPNDTLLETIHDSVQYLTHYGAIIKNELLDRSESGSEKSLPLFVDLREYQSYKGAHRGGWYNTCEELAKLNSKNQCGEPNGIICDMYVDRTFHWVKSYMRYRGIIPYTSPWCGFIHHTSNTTYSPYNSTDLFNIPEFIQSLHTCVALFSLSEPLSRYLRERLAIHAPHIKVITFAHPVVTPPMVFSPYDYNFNKEPKLINIGAWMRNPFTIYRLDKIPLKQTILVGNEMYDHLPPPHFQIQAAESHTDMKSVTEPDTLALIPCRSISTAYPRWVSMLAEWLPALGVTVNGYENGTLYIRNGDRAPDLNNIVTKMIQNVEPMQYQSNEAYDELLSKNIVFLDLVDAAAVNTIIECIVRRTPVVVNKIPGTVALLGEDYPLYYHNIADVPELLTEAKITKAHKYLKKLDVKRYRIEYFLNQMTKVVADFESDAV